MDKRKRTGFVHERGDISKKRKLDSGSIENEESCSQKLSSLRTEHTRFTKEPPPLLDLCFEKLKQKKLESSDSSTLHVWLKLESVVKWLENKDGLCWLKKNGLLLLDLTPEHEWFLTM
jgi:hypothetical protein